MDAITLRGIRAFGRHGWEPAERERAQPFVIDLEIELDLRAAQLHDDLDKTLDYATLHRRVVDVVEKTSFSLLERLAGEVLAIIFEDARVERAVVTIAKPALLDGATPAVRLDRRNPHHQKPA